MDSAAFNFVKLDSSQQQQVMQLAENESEEKTLRQIVESFLIKPDEKKAVFGAYKNSELKGLAVLVFADCRPWGSLLYMKINSTQTTTDRLRILTSLVDLCFEKAENAGCVRIFMINELQKRGSFLNAKLYPLVKKISRLQKYTFISESVVMAGEKPKYTYEWQMMGYRTLGQDVGVVSATRKLNEIKF
jgi:hypothetical protein